METLSPYVPLLLIFNLLHGLLHAIALLLGVIIALALYHHLTLFAVRGLQLVCLYHAAVLFLFLIILLLVSSSIILCIFDGILFLKVGIPLLSILSLALLSILSSAWEHHGTFVLVIQYLSVHLLSVYLLAVHLLSVYLLAVPFFMSTS